MLTRAAGPQMARIHNREPAILTADEIDSWLNSPLEEALKEVQAPFPSQLLAAWPVSTDVNKVANAGRKLMEPIGEALFSGRGSVYFFRSAPVIGALGSCFNKFA